MTGKEITAYEGEVGGIAPGSKVGVRVYVDSDGLHVRLTELYPTHREVKKVVMANAGDLPWRRVVELAEQAGLKLVPA